MNNEIKLANVLVDVSADKIDQLKAALGIVFSTIPLFQTGPFELLAEVSPALTHVRASLFKKEYVEGTRCTKCIGSFALEAFPGSSSLIVSTESHIRRDYRKQGFGTALHQLRLKAASLAKYTMILATVNTDNVAQIHLMNNFDWDYNCSFKNDQNETIGLWTKRLLGETMDNEHYKEFWPEHLPERVYAQVSMYAEPSSEQSVEKETELIEFGYLDYGGEA